MKTLKKLKVHKLLAVLSFSLGLLLMIYMVLVEDEPGAIPLLLIVLGLGWYFIIRTQIKSKLD